MLEPSITPTASVTPTPRASTEPTYYLDQIDVAVELPSGPQGEQGPPGTEWIINGTNDPPPGEFTEGSKFLKYNGEIWEYQDGIWVDTGVDLLPDMAGGTVPYHEHDDRYLTLVGGILTGALTGTDATFTGNVVVPAPDTPEEAVNLAYLNTTITNLNLAKFLGDISGNAIGTGGSWNAGEGQAIYQQTGGLQLPPGVSGATLGLTMKQSTGNATQLICDVTRNIWFTRTQVAGVWNPEWSTLTPIVSPNAPVDAPGAAPNGTIWIQVT